MIVNIYNNTDSIIDRVKSQKKFHR